MGYEAAMSNVAIIDYGSGNLRSAEKALARAADEHNTGHRITVTADPDVVAKADRIVLPGVGAFADCMAGLKALPGMVEAMTAAVKRGTPFLGICVGLQLLATVGREFGDHEGLGWIPGEVVKLTPADKSLKIPHMGWNELIYSRQHPLFDGLKPCPDVYFVHSFCLRPNDPAHILATSDYGGAFAAAVAKGNIAGFQFHPEKSQDIGQVILTNFLGWKP
jgi:imidazole glycerol-phosphate synthase subunit HisH